tara:strand:+ start:190 stop:360 length:171 start_codon:yes stop_codon:yes gene_type:complete
LNKDLWLLKLMRLSLRDLNTVQERLSKHEWGEGKVYLKLLKKRIESMIEYMDSSKS